MAYLRLQMRMNSMKEDKVLSYRFEYASTSKLKLDGEIEFFKWKDIAIKDIENEWRSFVHNVDSIMKKDGWVMSGSGFWHLHYIKGTKSDGTDGFKHCTSEHCFFTMNIT